MASAFRTRKRHEVRHRLASVAMAATLLAVLLVCLHTDQYDSSSGMRGAGGTERLRSVADWQRAFDARAAVENATIYGPLSRSPDSWDHYNLAFGLDGFLAMYRATSQRRYLETALGYAENLVASSRPSRELGRNAVGDDYRGWITHRPDEAGNEVPLFESFVWRYIAEMLRVIRTDPALWSDPRLRARYQVVLDFAEHDIVEKWATRSLDDTVYRERTHMASHWAYIALELAQITASPEQRQLDERIVHAVDDDLPNRGSSLHQQMVENPRNPAAYFWSDVWRSYAPPGQDVAHGNGVVAYIVAAHDLGSGWTAADIQALIALLRTQVWHPDGSFAEYIDGAGSTGNGWISDGFMKLGRYAPEIERRLESYNGDTPDNRAGEIQFLGNGALNARILFDSGDASSESPAAAIR